MPEICNQCHGFDTDGLPGANFPPSWKEISRAGTVFSPAVAASIGNGYVYQCTACGRYWRVGWNPRDNVFEGVTELPGGAKAVLRSDISPARAVSEGLEHPDTLSAMVRQWFAQSMAPPERLIEAIGAALAGRTGVLDGHALRQCLQWLEAIAARNETSARALASHQQLLEQLGTLAERPRPVADRIKVPTRVLTRIVDDIGRHLEPVCPAWAACLRALNAPEAIRERALAVLRLRLADGRYPHELVRQAIDELSSWEGAKLEFDEDEVDLLLDAYRREAGRGPGPCADIARSLQRAFEQWLRNRIIPPDRRIAMVQTIEAHAGSLSRPAAGDG